MGRLKSTLHESKADVAQSVERGPSKSNVARSNRVIRFFLCTKKGGCLLFDKQVSYEIYSMLLHMCGFSPHLQKPNILAFANAADVGRLTKKHFNLVCDTPFSRFWLPQPASVNGNTRF